MSQRIDSETIEYERFVYGLRRSHARLLAAAQKAVHNAAIAAGKPGKAWDGDFVIKELNAAIIEATGGSPPERPRQAGLAALISALEQVREYIDGQIDVVDGDYGVPAPNKAMRIAQEIDTALAKVNGGAS